MFFSLTMTATLETESTSTDVSGQIIKAWGSPVTVQCLYMPMSGSEKTNPRDEFSQSGSLYVDSNTTVQPGMRVITILDSQGNSVAKGPYLVQSVRTFVDLSGRTHHKTVMLAGLAGS